MGIAVKSDKIITLSDKVIVTQRSTNVEYGNLYNWYAVNNAHGLAPNGWHIPTKTEWDTLISYLTDNGYGYEGSGNDIAKSMASKTEWATSEITGSPGNNPASNNSSGLNLHSSGFRIGATFMLLSWNSFIWTATEYNTTESYIISVTTDSPNINDYGSGHMYKYLGLAVRFIRNNDTGWYGQKLVDIDGNIYDTVKIGNQILTCQNAATTRYKDGSEIPIITDGTAWAADRTGARCAYNNDNSYVFL